jgi:hypothetical protein
LKNRAGVTGGPAKRKAAGLTPDGGVMAKGEPPRARTLNHWTAARRIRFDPERQKAAELPGGFVIQLNRRRTGGACRASLIADKLFGPPAPFASESDEVWLGLPDFVPGYDHECAAV